MFPLIISLITIIFWLLSKHSLISITGNPLLSLSQIASLIGAVLLSFTFVLSSRFNFLEKYFGSLDQVYKKHHFIGAISFLLLISHPLLLTLQAIQDSISTTMYLLPSNNIIYTAGVLALYSLIIFLTFTLLIKLPYHLWYLTHQLMGIVLFFALIHINFITSDVSRFPLLKIWILAWILFALISYIYKRFFYVKNGPKSTYQVNKIENINGLLDLSLSPTEKPLKYSPGQFVFISFQQNGIKPEFHPFSIVSPQDSNHLRFCIKVFGDYTGSIIDLKPGSIATIMGPYGQLHKFYESDKNLVLIAGGIGITPFISMIDSEVVNPKNRQINLFYSNKNSDSAFNHQNFLEISTTNKNFKYHPIFTESDPRLSAAFISSHVSGFQSSTFLLCGPQTMMESIKNQLLELNIEPKNIYYEDFYLN